MFRFLFPRLTASEPRAAPLFAAAVREARNPFWFRDLGVPDTLDGRFSVLATVVALATVRLEQGGEAAKQASVGLAERFIESMDHEHRQLGYGDPTLGKIVRRLTSALAARVGRLRTIVDAGAGWEQAAADLQVEGPMTAEETAQEIQRLWSRLVEQSYEQLIAGHWQ